MIRQSWAKLSGVGSRLGITETLTLLAETQALEGMITDALGTIEEALDSDSDQLVYRPNILTYRGTLRLEQGHSELAETDFREAMALAQLDDRESLRASRDDKPSPPAGITGPS